MARRPKQKPTYRFFIKNQQGESINIDTLTEEERREVGVWAYQSMVRALGYRPAQEPEMNPVRAEVYGWAENYRQMMAVQKNSTR